MANLLAKYTDYKSTSMNAPISVDGKLLGWHPMSHNAIYLNVINRDGKVERLTLPKITFYTQKKSKLNVKLNNAYLYVFDSLNLRS